MAKQTVEFTMAETYGVGGYRFKTDDGTDLIFETIEEVRAYVESRETKEFAIAAGIGRLLHQEPNLTPNAQGKLPYLLSKAVDVELISADQVVIR